MSDLAAAIFAPPPQLARVSGPPVPEYGEEPLFASDPGRCFEELSRLDWAFSEDTTDFLGHDVHPYPAKFIPQLPGNLMTRLSTRGEEILDPFGGSGTTALEANRLGRRATSVDANPLAALIGRVKTAPLSRRGSLELQGLHAALAAERHRLPTTAAVLLAYVRNYVPEVPNREKWFSDQAFAELGLVKSRITGLETDTARDVALVALSRMAVWASFQDSETRYKSVPRTIPRGMVLDRYIRELSNLLSVLAGDRQLCRHGRPTFLTGDARDLATAGLVDGSFDLVVTSPPYGNATDYHLYHRFRLLWLGFSPLALGRLEIGSHLKHQREGSGFESYASDMERATSEMCRVLRPGRYAALVLGSSVYKGQQFDVAERLLADAGRLGFDAAQILRRPLPPHRRSFGPAARRATDEAILIMRKAVRSQAIVLKAPPYRLWPYEETLRQREATRLLGNAEQQPGGDLIARTDGMRSLRARDLVFSHGVVREGTALVPTWQAIAENGGAIDGSARKEPKYATHGLHAYKGKFYPQLARGLMNVAGVEPGACVLDPFCGSGTTLLEASMNGMRPFGCDMHPLAAQIARTKTDILLEEPEILRETVATLCGLIDACPARLPDYLGLFPAECREDIERWFPSPVARKLAWLLRNIRQHSGGVVRDFLEVVLSGIVRTVSQQEPTDLRIRYRAVRLEDADVFGLFRARLLDQFGRIEKFWSAYPSSPHSLVRATVQVGDNRRPDTFAALGLEPGTVDAVVTSPPYATALPYIDTDRLSLLVVHGLAGPERRTLEWGLIGSREISTGDRRAIEKGDSLLPDRCADFLRVMRERLALDPQAGFRKRNQPALLTRYLQDMAATMANLHTVCRPGAPCLVVIGDNRTELAGESLSIPTTDLVEEIGRAAGFTLAERLPITVTTDKHLHIRNAITANVVLWFERSP